MPYLVQTFDKPGSHDLRLAVRDEHLAYLAENAALLLACGAKLSDDGERADGGIYLLDLDTRGEAEVFIQADPFHRAGLFQRVEIQRWRKAYLDGTSYL